MGIEEQKEETSDIKLNISNIFLDEKTLKFSSLKILYDDYNIKINSKSYLTNSQMNEIKDLRNILSKESSFKCLLCQKAISSFEFYIQRESKEIKIICNDCYLKLNDINKDVSYISLDKYISTCDKHNERYEYYCTNCNINLCPKCKEDHLDFFSKHELIVYDNIFDKKEIKGKVNLCKKVKSLVKIFESISEIKKLESKYEEGERYHNIAERFSRENKLAEIIISTFNYFLNKKALCYEIITNFNEINYNKALKEIDIKSIFDSSDNILEESFHIIRQSSDIIENKKKIIPLSERNRIYSEKSLASEIRGIIELKSGYYIVASINGIIGIFDSEKLELKQYFRLEGINNIYHMEKIKYENSDLIAVASDLSEIIIISVFPKEKDNKDNKDNNEDLLEYKYVFRKKEHSGKLNRIIQLSNGLIVSSSEDKLVIFWQLLKNEKEIYLQSISKIEMDMNIHVLIECPFTNELICNNKTIDLNSLTPKRKLNIRIEGKTFNCSVCLFKEKYIGYVNFCDGISVINIETGQYYFITGKYDYVDAVYSIDNETFCLCTKDLEDIFGIFGGSGLSQQFKLDEDQFVEIGGITMTGVCNCYMTDSKNNFVMGNMSGKVIKFTLK